MFQVGDTVELKAKSKHGKDRIAQHGKLWRVKKIGKFKMRTAVLLESRHETFKCGDIWEKDGRWVITGGHNPDFEIIKPAELPQGEEND